jgi:hypothetical protein
LKFDMLFYANFNFSEMLVQLWKVNSCVNIGRKCKCYISKSKLILCEYNAFYFGEIAVIGFTVHEIKQGIVFFGTPGIWYILLIIFYLSNTPAFGRRT